MILVDKMIVIGEKKLELESFKQIVYLGQKVKVSDLALEKTHKSFSFLKEFSKNSIIYGVNTGLGPMAQYRISKEEQIELQYNLIRSHCAGAGNLIPDAYVKALMLGRLNSLIQGYSAIHEEWILLLAEYINHDIYPEIFEHGGVGASGDLVQLAHLALALIGEGNARYKGVSRPIAEILQEVGLKPATIHLREGLGIMNGTSCMTGIGLCTIIQAKALLNWSLLASCMLNEVAESYDDHFSKELNQVKLHPGQRQVAEAMRTILFDSKLIRRRSEHLYNKEIKQPVFVEKVQEYYSLRCIPQILGPILDTVKNCEKVLIDEVNSANDNPIVDVATHDIYHGGNFHGDYVSFEMDKLKIAITKMAMLAERQVNFLMNKSLNGKLPPFVNLGKLGFNFGMQGVQFTATSTVAENQTISYPMYLHSIPNNNDNQDIVSMGTNAALLAAKVVGNSYDVLAIELMSLLQAIDYLKFPEQLSSLTRDAYRAIRDVFPSFVLDSVKYTDIQSIKTDVLKESPDFL